MKRYRMAVCKGMDCKADGANELFALARRGLSARCELYRGGCYGLCHMGPNVIVREDSGRKRDPLSREDFQLMGWEGEAYYARMTEQRLLRVIAEHIAEDRPVPELYGQPEE